eukprot:3628143-Rhodomonas_salina.9
MLLCARYAVCGTERVYGPTPCVVLSKRMAQTRTQHGLALSLSPSLPPSLSPYIYPKTAHRTRVLHATVHQKHASPIWILFWTYARYTAYSCTRNHIFSTICTRNAGLNPKPGGPTMSGLRGEKRFTGSAIWTKFLHVAYVPAFGLCRSDSIISSDPTGVCS